MSKTIKPAASMIDERYVGQDFEAFLAEDGIASEVEALAIKKVLVALLEQSQLSQVALAAKVQTSRTQIRRLLDPSNTAITLSTMQRAAQAVGHRLVLQFEPVGFKQTVAA